MGPRLISRGVGGQCEPKREGESASMGPRLISRGVFQGGLNTGFASQLQWGRGSLAAAWGGELQIAVPDFELQWGRGSLAAA